MDALLRARAADPIKPLKTHFLLFGKTQTDKLCTRGALFGHINVRSDPGRRISKIGELFPPGLDRNNVLFLTLNFFFHRFFFFTVLFLDRYFFLFFFNTFLVHVFFLQSWCDVRPCAKGQQLKKKKKSKTEQKVA